MIFLVINYHLEKTKCKHLKFEHFAIFLYKALRLKEVNIIYIVDKWDV